MSLSPASRSQAPGFGDVTVTGAAGFIGAALCRRLAADGVDVVGIDLDRAARGRVEAAGARFLSADITDPGGIAAALRGAGRVVHAAALVADRGAMAQFVQVNTRGTRNVLDAADSQGARVVVLGSVAAWGYEFRRDVAESSPPRACGLPYVDTKGATETMALLRGHVVVRPGDVYGPGSEPWVLRPLRAMRQGTFRLPGRGDGVMTPVYVDDLVDAIVRALDAPGGRAYTVWDGTPRPAREFFAPHARWAGLDRIPTAPRPLLLAGAAAMEAMGRGEVTRRALTFVSRRAAYPNARAREELGWAPRVRFPDGVARTEAWLREERLL